MSATRLRSAVFATVIALSLGYASAEGRPTTPANAYLRQPAMQNRALASRQRWTNFPYSFKNGAFPAAVALGADGNFWIADYRNGIVRMDPSGKTVLFTLPALSGEPATIVRGYGNDLWFAGGYPWVGRITTAGTMTLLPLSYRSNSVGIARGRSGSIWFTDPAANQIGRVSPNGTISEFPIPTPNSEVDGIALGPDGDMWFTETRVSKIGRITPHGSITEFPAAAAPGEITSGPGTYFSYTSMPLGGGECYIYMMTTDGQTHVQVDIGRGLYGTSLQSDGKGHLWATVSYGPGLSELDRITADGFVTAYPPPPFTQYGDSLAGFAFGRDGSLWIGDYLSSGIDVFRPR
jgi:virginiamycin B lyase